MNKYKRVKVGKYMPSEPCKGCVARGKSKLCESLPTCYDVLGTAQYIFKKVVK